MLIFIALFVATLFLAYSNGANDNFKGVATLFGSRTVNYRLAIAWATLTTFAGSLASIFFATTLVKNFSGKGLVPDAIANTSEFHLAVALGAGLTVILATVLGFPISTTHGLTGALIGAGLLAIGTQVNFAMLGKAFFLPLLLSPILAVILTSMVYAIAHFLRMRFNIQKIQNSESRSLQRVALPVMVGNHAEVTALPHDVELTLTCDRITERTESRSSNGTGKYAGRLMGVQTQKLIDTCHFLTAGIVSFARGLNDTPKIVSIVLIGQALSLQSGALAVALAMMLGGLLNARKVAETMSHKITALQPGEGLSANFVTGLLVIAASNFGLPVSTTHVSVGAIFGVGLVKQQANYKVVYQILLSWILTLPIAALLSAIFYGVLRR